MVAITRSSAVRTTTNSSRGMKDGVEAEKFVDLDRWRESSSYGRSGWRWRRQRG
jgi:hypothetical protein